MPTDFFPQRPDISPTIYAYELRGVSSHKGYLKVGYTERDVETRVKEQLRTPGLAAAARRVPQTRGVREQTAAAPAAVAGVMLTAARWFAPFRAQRARCLRRSCRLLPTWLRTRLSTVFRGKLSLTNEFDGGTIAVEN